MTIFFGDFEQEDSQHGYPSGTNPSPQWTTMNSEGNAAQKLTYFHYSTTAYASSID